MIWNKKKLYIYKEKTKSKLNRTQEQLFIGEIRI